MDNKRNSVLLSFISVVKNDLIGLDISFQSIKHLLNKDQFEWIVVVGGSIEIDDYVNKIPKNARIRFYKELTPGIYSAMNYGVSMASGDWLFFLNAKDQFLLSEESIGKYLLKGEHMSVLSGHVLICMESKRIVYPMLAPSFPRSIVTSCQIAHQASFISRFLHLEIGGFDSQFKSSGDYDYWCRVWKYGIKISQIPAIISLYDGYGLSSTNVMLRTCEDLIIKTKYFNGYGNFYKWLVKYSVNNRSKYMKPLVSKILMKIEKKVAIQYCSQDR